MAQKKNLFLRRRKEHTERISINKFFPKVSFYIREARNTWCPPHIKKLNKNSANSSKLQRVQVVQAAAS
jgi:hypothetical protein